MCSGCEPYGEKRVTRFDMSEEGHVLLLFSRSLADPHGRCAILAVILNDSAS